MLLVLVAGIASWYLYRVRVQSEAVLAIIQAEGHVTYDWERETEEQGMFSRVPVTTLTGWRKWVSDRFGLDSVCTVVGASIGRGATDEHVARIARLSYLKELSIGPAVSLTERGYAHIERLDRLQTYFVNDQAGQLPGEQVVRCIRNHRGLKRVILNGVRLTDRDLAHLSGLSDLEELSIYSQYAPITDEALVHLAGLTRLKRLDLGRTEITTAGLRHLQNMKELEDLTIDSPRITDLGPISRLPRLRLLMIVNSATNDAEFAALAQANNLVSLTLLHMKVTEAGLDALRDLKNLKVISAWDTPITDAGLKHLAGFPYLEHLAISGPEITPAGVAEFREANPRISIRTR